MSAPNGETPGAPAGSTDPVEPQFTAPEADNGTKPSARAEGKPNSQNVDDLPEWAQKIIRDTRQEAANHRAAKSTAEQQHQSMLAGIAKALGLTSDEISPEQLQAQLAERDKQVSERDGLLADMLRERQAEKAARHHKADIDLLMPAISYNGLLDDLDPNADDFADKVDKIVGEFVEKNPKYLAAASFPDLRQGNQGQGAAASTDPNAWLRHMAGRS